jgi:hypothetical protein
MAALQSRERDTGTRPAAEQRCAVVPTRRLPERGAGHGRLVQGRNRAEITVFTDHLSDPNAAVQRLRPYDVVCAMRERTPLLRKVIERLPRLRMIASTGPVNPAIDAHAAERNILVTATGYWSAPDGRVSSLSIISRASRHQSTHACSVRRPAFRTR